MGDKRITVKKISRSIELMDQLYYGEVDSIELKNWFYIKRSKSTNDSGQNSYYVSLIIEGWRLKNQEVRICLNDDLNPITMTDLRKIQGGHIRAWQKYSEDFLYKYIIDASKEWKTEFEIALPYAIYLRAQTSENKEDYGCEWIGGGDWEEKTLYGDTEDFFITKIILTPIPSYTPKDIEAENLQHEIEIEIKSLQQQLSEMKSMILRVNQKVKHKLSKYGAGYIESIDNPFDAYVQFTVKFESCKLKMSFPSAFSGGFLMLIDNGNLPDEYLSTIEILNQKKKAVAEIKETIDVYRKFRYTSDIVFYENLCYVVEKYKNI